MIIQGQEITYIDENGSSVPAIVYAIKGITAFAEAKTKKERIQFQFTEAVPIKYGKYITF